MQTSFWQKEIVGGVKVGWLAAILGFYLFFYLSYAATLAFTQSGQDYTAKLSLLQILTSYFQTQGIDYALKFVLTIPLCVFYFRWIKKWQLSTKIILHFFTLVIYVFTWKKIFYVAMESIGKGHLQGASEAWDVYIPALFYCIQFSFFHAFEYYYQFQKQREVEFQLRQLSLQNELSALKAQLNPHFLYNVFNTISASVPPEQERTREMIADLADLFRYQLKASRTELVLLRDEIEFVEKYLDLEKARFGERLVVKTDIEQSILDEKIPSMILQPIVENCLKHGLASKIEGGEVSISIKKEGNVLKFDIRDTGVGEKDKSVLLSGEGIGLRNTQLRLEKLYNSTLIFFDNQPTGLVVSFEIAV